MFYGIYTKCLECRKKLKFQNRYYIEVDSSFFLGLTWLQYQYSVSFLNHQFSIFLKNMYEVLFILIPFLLLIPVMRQTVKFVNEIIRRIGVANTLLRNIYSEEREL